MWKNGLISIRHHLIVVSLAHTPLGPLELRNSLIILLRPSPFASVTFWTSGVGREAVNYTRSNLICVGGATRRANIFPALPSKVALWNFKRRDRT